MSANFIFKNKHYSTPVENTFRNVWKAINTDTTYGLGSAEKALGAPQLRGMTIFDLKQVLAYITLTVEGIKEMESLIFNLSRSANLTHFVKTLTYLFSNDSKELSESIKFDYEFVNHLGNKIAVGHVSVPLGYKGEIDVEKLVVISKLQNED